jgi:hypothetical protein
VFGVARAGHFEGPPRHEGHAEHPLKDGTATMPTPMAFSCTIRGEWHEAETAAFGSRINRAFTFSRRGVQGIEIRVTCAEAAYRLDTMVHRGPRGRSASFIARIARWFGWTTGAGSSRAQRSSECRRGGRGARSARSARRWSPNRTARSGRAYASFRPRQRWYERRFTTRSLARTGRTSSSAIGRDRRRAPRFAVYSGF